MISLSNPQVKGALTGVVMVLTYLVVFLGVKNPGTFLQSLVYVVYAAGITASVFFYSKSESFKGTFGDSFLHAFKTFIVAALVMAVFTYIFLRMHPEFANEYAESYRQYLIDEKKTEPGKIAEEYESVKKNYVTLMMNMLIFSHLIIGALVSVVASLFVVKRK